MRYTVLYLSIDTTIEDSCKVVFNDLIKFIVEIEDQKYNSIQNKVISNRCSCLMNIKQIKTV